MTTVKTEGFQYPQPRSRPDFRRPFSDGSMTIATEALAASLPTTSQFLTHFPYDHQPFINPYAFHNHPVPTESQPSSQVLVDERSRSLSRGSIGKAPRSRSGRKGSMNDTKPVMPRIRTASNRAMSYSHPDGRLGLGLDTHLEGERTNSISPPDFTFGIAPNGWTGSGSLPSMQSFGTTIDEAILDSPFSPTFNLPGLPFDANEESKKQRRRECHNQVEKRRREHINTKIDELSQLLPPQYQQVEEALDEEEDEADADSPKKRKNRRNSAAKQKDLARCKGRILTHSVQYIHDLRHVNTLQATRIQQLESMLAGTSFASQSVFQPQSTIMLEQRGLEVMQPSPEPENFMQASWNTFNPVFEPSPDSFNTASTSGTSGPSIDDSHTNGRSKPAHTRHDSQMSIQMGMTDMDLDSVFAARRDDDSVLRW